MEILQNFVAFSEYMNFNIKLRPVNSQLSDKMFNRVSKTSLGWKVFGTLGTFFICIFMVTFFMEPAYKEYIMCATMKLGAPISNIGDLYPTKGKMPPRIEND